MGQVHVHLPVSITKADVTPGLAVYLVLPPGLIFNSI